MKKLVKFIICAVMSSALINGVSISDNSNLSAWAVEAAGQVRTDGIMSGIDNSKSKAADLLQYEKTIVFSARYDFKLSGKNDRINFVCLLPDDYEYRQKIKSTNFSLEPTRIFYDGGNKYAEFDVYNQKKDFAIEIDFTIDVMSYDFSTAEQLSNVGNLSDSDRSKYLSSEKYIETDDFSIENVKFHAKDEVELLRDIFDFVVLTMKYSGYNPGSEGAVRALKTRQGDCTEYSDLFVALCRANNIPARSMEGWVVFNNSEHDVHNWSEAYLEKYGWIPFDTILADDQSGSNTSFANMQDLYIYQSFIRNDMTLNNFHYYKWTYWGDKIDVIRNSFVE